MTAPSYTLSEATIKAIGDDLISQYLNNTDWLFEAVSSLTAVIIGEDGTETPLFNQHEETLDVRVALQGYLTTKFEEMIRIGYSQTNFTY